MPSDAKQWSRGTDFSIRTKQPWQILFLAYFWSPAFELNEGVAINESHSYTLPSAILKADVVCDVALMSNPNMLTTELRDLLYNQCIDNMCCYSFFIYPMDRIRVCKIWFVSTGENSGKPGLVCKNIRIFNGCEVQIENSVMRVTVWHHKAYRCIPRDEIFNLHQTTIIDCFSCILFLRQLHLGLNRCCFINFTLKLLNYLSRNVRFSSYLRRWLWNLWWKMTSKLTSWHHAQVILHPPPPPCKSTFICMGWVHRNSSQVCKKI